MLQAVGFAKFNMNRKNISGLFINCVKAQDSIYESGLMVFKCLENSENYSLDYIEIDFDHLSISTNYDFYIFNYHMITMSWLDTKALRNILPGLKMTIVLEVMPNDPFIYCSPEDFDAFCVLDPTLNTERRNVFAFPRPLETVEHLDPYEEKSIPVIGSFGFATTGKGFENVIDAVNKEFDKAVVRINIPFATYADETHVYAKFLERTCKDKAKDGVEVIVTHDFMSKLDLIQWCRQNTVNCFLYDRNMPGLAATTDQAVSSGRPLCISKNNTFRHIQKYIKPFPYQGLREAIEKTGAGVEKIQNDWSPLQFRKRFEEVLAVYDFPEKTVNHKTIELPLKQNPTNGEVVKRSFPQKVIGKVKKILSVSISTIKKSRNSDAQKTSYSQFGEDEIIYNLLSEIKVQNIRYLDIGANNPKYISNTYLFYEKGFSGVLVEPNVVLCEKLRAVRPRDVVLNVGIGTDANISEADFYLFPEEADGLSTFSPEEAQHWEEVGMGDRKFKVEKIIKMPLVLVNDIIAENFTECPDFISIDVEGWDLKILKTLDFEKYSPAVFCVETLAYKDDGSTYRIEEIFEFMESKGYFSFHQTYANDIFVNRNLYDFYIYQKKHRKQ